MYSQQNYAQSRSLSLFVVTGLLASSASADSPDLAVQAVGMTVSDVDRAVDFYSNLTFRKVSDIEVFGTEYEHLEGVFGARMRIVRMQLGEEFIDLTQYLAPPGRPDSGTIRAATTVGSSMSPLW